MDGNADISNKDSESITITIAILVGGVIGGLILVLLVIVCCKYCMSRNKSLSRQNGFKRADERDRKSFKPFKPSGYESIPSASISTDAHTSQVDTRISDEIEEESGRDDCIAEPSTGKKESKTLEGIPEASCDVVTEKITKPVRKVSFKLKADNRDMRAAYAKEGRRYTDGDYHHLKKWRIDKDRAFGQRNIARQITIPMPDRIHEQYPPTFADKNSIKDDMFGKEFPASLTSQREGQQQHPRNDGGQTRVEIHQDASSKPSPVIGTRHVPRWYSPRASPRDVNGNRPADKKAHAQSLEVVSQTDKLNSPVSKNKRVHSYEGVLHDYFGKGPHNGARAPILDDEVVSDNGQRLRANITNHRRVGIEGCQEGVKRDPAEEISLSKLNVSTNTSGSESETLNGSHKYQELWSLRATLEDDDLSDVLMTDDGGTLSPDTHVDEGNASSYTTSFESNTEPLPYIDENESMKDGEASTMSRNLLQLPNRAESRRKNYQSILNKRLARRLEPKSSTDNSFDSVSTEATTSESSRPEMTTTSFETSTENTDSTNDSAAHRLQQMKHDSGYKSQSQSQSVDSTMSLDLHVHQVPRLKKQLQFADKKSFEIHEIPAECSVPKQQPDVYNREQSTSTSSDSIARQGRRLSNHGVSFDFVRRSGRTASKKRREFHRERQQLVHTYDSFKEPETENSCSDVAPSGDSFDDQVWKPERTDSPTRFPFSRLFNKLGSRSKDKPRSRDYSIDEKTDEIFNAFIQQDPAFDNKIAAMQYKPGRSGRQRKCTVPLSKYKEPRSRTLSMDVKSRRMSPQDSIEEEYLQIECAKTYEGIEEANSQGIPTITLVTEEEH